MFDRYFEEKLFNISKTTIHSGRSCALSDRIPGSCSDSHRFVSNIFRRTNLKMNPRALTDRAVLNEISRQICNSILLDDSKMHARADPDRAKRRA